MRFSKKVASVVMVGVVLFGLGLTGCAPTFTPEEAYVSAVHGQILGSETNTGRDIVALGSAVCEALDSGISESQVVSIVVESGFTVREAQFIVDAAEKFLCTVDGGRV